ncbi:MAG: RNA polymerase sigma factor, RpoD/SigA family [Cyanobacteria bacterium CRU_2_1]|nr:RNA polymerase sigma factor, RpoD/SigA family [Cyanobacteria bacterium RU_5_0]NJR57689.1 RNA polymerase sigma factor, RpoD/SigA family [Cyanobacteria bacterium CRU_2_1]
MKTAAISTDSVKSYLQQIGRIPLLTHAQEIQYGKQVQQFMAVRQIKDTLTSQSGSEPTLAEWAQAANLSEVELQNAIAEGEAAKRKMVEANLRLVVAIAKQYSKRSMDLLDLIQEGNIGIQRGVEKFDPSRGYRFSTYAYWWIRQAITRAIAEKEKTIRLPIHITEKLSKLKRAQHRLAQKLGRAATVAELAQELEIESQHVRKFLEWARHPLSLDMRINEDHDATLSEMLIDPSASPETFLMQTSLQIEIQQLLTYLTPNQREVLSLRFGLSDGTGLSLAAVGERLHLSRERVRQIEQKALARLRQCKFELRRNWSTDRMGEWA